MKKILLLGAAAALMLASCSKEKTQQDVGQEETGNGKYVTVAIRTSSQPTKADSDLYEAGTQEESDVKEALFVFYGANGKFSQMIAIDENAKRLNTDPKSPTYGCHEYIVTLRGTAIDPEQLVVILNASDQMKSNIYFAGSTLDGLRKRMNDYISEQKNNGDKFIMTNSVYKYESNIIDAVTLEKKHFYTQNSDNTGKEPVEIYVERVVAKVEVTKGNDFNIEVEEHELANGENDNLIQKQITPVIKKIYVTNSPTKGRLLKNISNIDEELEKMGLSSFKWNDENLHRSFWASGSGYGTGTGVEGYNRPSYAWIEQNAYNFDAEKPVTQYIHPNTRDSDPISKGKTFNTKLIVIAELQVDGKAVDLVKYKGTLYLKSEFLKHVANYLKNQGFTYTIPGSDGGEDVVGTYTPDHFEFVKSTAINPNPWQINVRLKSDAPKVTSSTTEGVDAENELTKALDVFGDDCWNWNNGRTYYYMEIRHQGFEGLKGLGEKDFLFGTIRNHVYKISLNGIKGLGTPVFDPEEPINPEHPDDDPKSYIQANVRILDWRIVNQNAVLE